MVRSPGLHGSFGREQPKCQRIACALEPAVDRGGEQRMGVCRLEEGQRRSQLHRVDLAQYSHRVAVRQALQRLDTFQITGTEHGMFEIGPRFFSRADREATSWATKCSSCCPRSALIIAISFRVVAGSAEPIIRPPSCTSSATRLVSTIAPTATPAHASWQHLCLAERSSARYALTSDNGW